MYLCGQRLNHLDASDTQWQHQLHNEVRACALQLAVLRHVEVLISAAAVVTICPEEARSVLLYGHASLGLASATGGHLFITLPWAGHNIHVAIGVERRTCVHLHIASQNLLDF